MSCTTPHYYPKYEIWSIENKFWDFPFKYSQGKLQYKTRKWTITSKGGQRESKESHPMKVAWYPRQIAVDTFMEVSLAVKETKLVVSRPGRSGIIGSRAALAFFSDTGPPNLLFPFQPKRKLTPLPSLRRALVEVRRLWGDLHLLTHHPFFCSFCSWDFVTFQSCTDFRMNATHNFCHLLDTSQMS